MSKFTRMRSVFHRTICTKKVLRSSFVCTNDQHAMYSAKGSSAPYDGEKQKKECNAISMERRAVRLLSRRYTLTTTGYKFLEIGINVGPPSYMEIALGDHRGQELLKTWKELYEQRWNIYKLL
ncbi:uncharacterized protein LOC105423448 [Pogonomyrmex barbatus]|uniref:Uncharacterized protein LOC105423448 n=1 Tax=Pogonomyrmex barbatus TaxID=144034 RepID=A0A6I9WIG2_9HYME|nr:uncharacterized protein LOC105423448 [Pogonomyrmex barbatus]